MANCAWVPASVEKIVPSALRLPPGVRHECRGAGEFQAGTVSGVLILMPVKAALVSARRCIRLSDCLRAGYLYGEYNFEKSNPPG